MTAQQTEINEQLLQKKAGRIIDNMNQVLVGQQKGIFLAAAAFFAGGHVLLEDVPGVGKTLLAKALAKSVSADFKRIQCTPDLLPSDITGVRIYDQHSGEFEFVPGPIFANIILADEINRATPRTQSSLLEAMEEKQVTVDGDSKNLDELFFVIATQNPIEYHGTFPLPEAQLDRFMMTLNLGYPTIGQEVEILNKTLVDGGFDVQPILTVAEVLAARQRVREVTIEESLKQYIVHIAQATRQAPDIALGVSPRGSQLLMRASQAAAFLSGRDFVTPDDLKLLAPFVFGHRIVPKHRHNKVNNSELISKLLATISVPL